jgi:type IV pilus assembly protein PilZ
MQDRRVDPRAEAELEVHYRTPQEFLAAYSRNISGGGIFIRTQQPLPLNQKVLVRFTLPGVEHRFEVHGVVVWANAASVRSSLPAGMGIKFLVFDASQQKMIADFIKQSRSTGPAAEQKS